MRICFIGTNTRFGLCALISAYPRETALKKRILYPYVVYADIRICNLCGLHKDVNTLCGLGKYVRTYALI